MSKKQNNASIENIYALDGKVPILKSIPFGLQHVLAMFVANIAPIVIVAGASGLSPRETASLIQTAMIVAGIGTLLQLFSIWKLGARLPIVMGISFTFVSVFCYIASQWGYDAVIGAVIVGGIFEGLLGLFAKYWRRIIAPIVSACVVTAIGFSLLSVGANSFAGGSGSADFGSADNWILGSVTLACCILFNIFAKGHLKQLSVLFGLVVGYIVALCMGMVDMSALEDVSIVSLPEIMPYKPEFNINAIISVCMIFLVSATETIGDTSAMTSTVLNREPTEKEITGSLACDGFVSSLSACFGCMPVTSFSQNVGLLAMSKVINRFTIATGAGILILSGIFPAIGAVLATLPEAVLGGCTIIMFGNIVISGLQMIGSCGFTQRNITIAAISLSIGLGFTQVPEMFDLFPDMIRTIFAENCVAVVFISSIIMNLVLPKDMELKRKKGDNADDE
ncbi:MAG: purine permease [Clostridia bacterium]|nr:purine permease [Clostridia bacterium]